MKKCFWIFSILLIITSGLNLFSQNLPESYSFSEVNDRLTRSGIQSSGLYNESQVDTIFIEFGQSNYWSLLTANYEDKIDIPATLSYKGITYDSVGVRFRGQTSYMNVNGDKKSFNISLDYHHDSLDIDGYETLNLINGYEDPSFIREVLYFNMCRKNIAAAKGNFVILYINGSNWGLYSNIQQLDKDHVKEWFFDDEATRWRGEGVNSGSPGGGGGGPGGGGPGGSGFGAGESSLNYLGTDTSDYVDKYTLKKSYKENPWDDLLIACDKLNNTSSANLVDELSPYFDIDDALWYLAHEILFTDEDSYVNKGGMDYYIYFDVKTGRIVPQVYDGNSSISLSKANSWSVFYNETNTDYALQNKLFAVPKLRQRYLAHVRTILKQSFDTAISNLAIENYANLINQHVQNDPKKLYSYSDFQNEIDEIKEFFEERSSYLWNTQALNVESPTITDFQFVSDGQLPESISVSAELSHSQGIINAYLYFSNDLAGNFEKIEMFDDGNHNDAMAGDNIFGAEISNITPGTYVRFYVEAIANNTAKTCSFTPEGAEHDVYIYKSVSQPGFVLESELVINELMSSNTNTISDQDGEFDDWIELYNNSNASIDISGYFLSDEIDELDKWEFPQGTTIDAESYLIIWADDDEEQEGLHSSFKLSADGESLYLSNSDTVMIDTVMFGASVSDTSFARKPNGTGDFLWTSPTYNFNNDSNSIEPSTILNNSVEIEDYKIFPNPASNYIQIEKNDTKEEVYVIYNSLGSKIKAGTVSKSKKIYINNWHTGLYLIKINDKTKPFIVKQ